MTNTDSFQHFRILQRPDGTLWELGRGAMGITYKAFDTNLRYDVALKVINAQLITSDSVKQRFIREARSAAQLSHPNVARVFHLGETDAGFFYAMEFVDGETVERRVQRTGPIRLDLALRIVRQVTRALIAAERQRLVHRDIKPSNIMLVHSEDDEHIQVKVIDFGLAKSLVSSADLSGAITVGGFVGTPHFASPEQLKEQNVDLRSDIYSLGATLWFMITGQPPFRGAIAEVIYDHMAVSPSEEILRQMPASMADLLRKMLAKAPEDRFQSPLELSQTLDQLLKDVQPIAAATPVTVPVIQSASAPESIFSTGQIIANRYEVRQRWAADDSVFLAVDLQNQQPVGLRVFLPRQLPISDPREAERFYFLRDVRHPNLVQIQDIAYYESTLVLVSEWVHGFTLQELLRVRRELPWPEVLVLVRPFASVLDFLTDRQELKGVIKLRKTYVGFSADTADVESLQHSLLSSWPTYSVKADTLDLCTDLQPAEPTETLVTGSNLVFSDHPIRQLAVLLYELLGGAPNPSGSAAGTSRFAPLPKLTENGNSVLRRALLDPDYFPSAVDFFAELERFNRRDFHSEAIKYAVESPRAPLAPPLTVATAPPLTPREVTTAQNPIPSAPLRGTRVSEAASPPPKRRRGPAAFLLGGVAAVGLGFLGYKVFERFSPGLATPSAVTGTFSVSSSPTGATVRWQGQELGTTPLVKYGLPPGDQTVELVLPNYAIRPIEFAVKEGGTLDLGVINLIKESGKIKLATNPSGVAFQIVGPDQKTVSGKTPATLEDLSVGKYQISLSQPGWPDYSETVELTSKNPVEITHDFRGIDVTLSSDPSGASIFLGKAKLGETPLTVNLPPGQVEIISRFGQLAPVVQTVNPDPKWVTAVQFKHAYGTAAITSDRSDAHAFVDGKEIGRPPIQTLLTPGSHKVLLTAANASDKTRTVSLAEGQHLDLRVDFGPGNSTNVSSPFSIPTPTPSATVTPTPAPIILSTPAPIIVPASTPAPTVAPSATAIPKTETAKPTASPEATVESTPKVFPTVIPTPTATPSSTATITPSPSAIATPSPAATPIETPPATPAPEATVQENSRSRASRTTRATPTPRVRPTPANARARSTPPPTRQIYQLSSRTPASTVKATPRPTPDAQKRRAKDQSFHMLDAEWAAKQNALKAEKQDLDYQVRNSTGATQNQWKQKLGQWQKEKAQADKDHNAAKAALNKEWGQ
jgi:serine/threonine protein kinase